MNGFWLYPIHLAALAAGVVTLWVLHQRDANVRTKVIAGILMSLAMAVFSYSIAEPQDPFSDFYKAYLPAAKALFAHNEQAGLAATMRNGAGGFVNLPILAWLFAPFALFPPVAAGYVFFILGVIATVGAWYFLARLAGLDLDRSLLLLFVFAACGPLHNSLREGNTTHFILLLVIIGLWALRRKLDFTAGLIFGLAALIKLPLLLLGIYFVARGRWRVGFGGASICALAAILSLAMFGWDLHVFWYEHSIKPFAEMPMAAFNVQSIQGFFSRLQYADAHLMDWNPYPLDPLLRTISRLTVGLLMLAVMIVIGSPKRWRHWFSRKSPESDILELEVCIIMILALMVSTVSWSHYYLWLLLPAALMIGGRPLTLTSLPLRIAGGMALVMALPPVLAVQFGNPMLAKIHGYFAVSHYLFAAGMLIAVLLFADWRSTPPNPDTLRK